MEVIRLGLQFAAYPYADIMLDTLNSALTVGEILFLLATLGYTFIDLSAYYLPEIAFGAVIFLTCVPTFIVFMYELGNLYLTYRIKKGRWWGLGFGVCNSVWCSCDWSQECPPSLGLCTSVPC